jgi:hypothetical protein
MKELESPHIYPGKKKEKRVSQKRKKGQSKNVDKLPSLVRLLACLEASALNT